MGWHYGLKKKDDYYTLAEIYGEDCYTADNLVIGGSTPQEIIENLELILKDLKNPDIIDITKEE